MKTTIKRAENSIHDGNKHFILLHESRGPFIIDSNLIISVFNKNKEYQEGVYNSIIKLSSGNEYTAYETTEEIFNILKQ